MCLYLFESHHTFQKISDDEGMISIKEELKMTQMTVGKLLSDKKELSKSNRDLRFQIMTLKKDILKRNQLFVIEKSKLRTKCVLLKKEKQELEKNLKSVILDDDDFFTDPDTGVIDFTTPKKMKSEFVRS